MSGRYFDFWDVLRDNLSKIMIVVGVILVIVGLVSVSDYYVELPVNAAVPVVLMFVGIVLVVYGFFVQVGLFSVKWMSINGLGTVLLCIAVGFFAIAVVSMQIQLVTGFFVRGEPSRAGGVHLYDAIPMSVRPLLPLFGDALQFGAIFLAVSVVLKVFSFFRS